MRTPGCWEDRPHRLKEPKGRWAPEVEGAWKWSFWKKNQCRPGRLHKQRTIRDLPPSLLIQSQPYTLYSWGCGIWGAEGFSVAAEDLFVMLFCCVFPTFLLLLYHSFTIGSANPLVVLCHLHRMEANLQGPSQEVKTRNKTLTKSPKPRGFISVQNCEGYKELNQAHRVISSFIITDGKWHFKTVSVELRLQRTEVWLHRLNNCQLHQSL